MRDLDQGHQKIYAGLYHEAYAYFTLMKSIYRHEQTTLRGCLYGQARALIGMNRANEAKPLLQSLIASVPSWEAPYITLARVYEAQGHTHKQLGQQETAELYIQEAEKIYHLALNQTQRSQRLTQHFEYFLKEHSSPWEQQNTFTPSFTHQRRPTPNSTITPAESSTHPKLAIR